MRDMKRRGSAAVFCGGIMLAAAVAWVVGRDLSDRYSYDTYANLVGGSGIAASLFALLALLRRGWARVPLFAAIAVSTLMAYARFGPPDPMAIDLTPLYLPPLIFVFGSVALIMTVTAETNAEHAPRGRAEK